MGKERRLSTIEDLDHENGTFVPAPPQLLLALSMEVVEVDGLEAVLL